LIGGSVEQVELGNRLVDEAGMTMKDVLDSVKRVTLIMSEIMNASEEQATGIEQINLALTQMDQVTQQNAALVEEAAAAAESMREQAETLVTAVSVFKLRHGAPTGVSPRAGAQPSSPRLAPPSRRAMLSYEPA